MSTLNGFSNKETFTLVKLMSRERVFYNAIKVFHSFDYLSDKQDEALKEFCKQEDSKFIIENMDIINWLEFKLWLTDEAYNYLNHIEEEPYIIKHTLNLEK